MRLLRLILALVFTTALPLAANECLLAAAFPSQIADCCEHGEEPASPLPEGSDCAHCVIMNTGANLTALPCITAGATEWREEVLLTDRLRLALELIQEQVPTAMPESPPEHRPLWHLVVRTALPVRGPSFA